MKPGVYITFDVECSMGGAWNDDTIKPVPPSRAIWGRYGDRELGLPLITQILQDSGLAVTFFVEPFNKELGHPGKTEDVCKYLIENGHDVQLHVHPNHKQYSLKQQGKDFIYTDQIAHLSADAQLALLQEGSRRLEQWTGKPPVAFRAGNMGASEETLRQLGAAGIHIDSSYTFPYVGKQCEFADTELYNGSKWYGDVLEMALSAFYQPNLPGLHPTKPVDLVGISFEECRDATEKILAAGADVVLILHSFSLFKVRNHQYDGGKLNRVVARRLRRMCEWLARNAKDAPTYTFTQLADAVAEGKYDARTVPPCRLNRPLRAVTRKLVQAANRAYWI